MTHDLNLAYAVTVVETKQPLYNSSQQLADSVWSWLHCYIGADLLSVRAAMMRGAISLEMCKGAGQQPPVVEPSTLILWVCEEGLLHQVELISKRLQRDEVLLACTKQSRACQTSQQCG